jgi:CubicO group peptidase (beta-lactamase class C family)
MKRCGRLLAVALLAITFLASAVAWSQPLPVGKAEQVGMASDRLDRIGTVFKQEIDQGKLPGVVIMVARKGQLAYSTSVGFRDKGSQAAMSNDAIFRIYSMTKPLVSVAAMILVEEGKIQLTDPVSKFLPAFAKMQVSERRTDYYGNVSYVMMPAERAITVQDLLRHTAGLAYGEITMNAPVKDAYAKAGVFKPGVMDYDSRDLTPQEQVEQLAKVPLIHQPGTFWEYSLATDLLGRVVEAACGKMLGEFLDERVFKPLKMNDTGFFVPQEKISRLAQALPTDPATGAPNKLLDVSQPPKNASGGAGGVSTAGDYLRFSQMLLNGGILDGVRILSRTTIKLMASDHLGDRIGTPVNPGELLLGTPGYTFGLGFTVRKGPGVAGVAGSEGEYMWAGYAGTYFWVDPQEQLVGVLMSQQPGPSRAYYRKMIKNLVYQAITD